MTLEPKSQVFWWVLARAIVTLRGIPSRIFVRSDETKQIQCSDFASGMPPSVQQREKDDHDTRRFMCAKLSTTASMVGLSSTSVFQQILKRVQTGCVSTEVSMGHAGFASFITI